MLLSPGQAGDNPMLVPLLTAHRERQRAPFRLLADKAYSHPSTRAHLRTAKISHTIPERSDQIAHRKAKGSRGGRPPSFTADTYRHRNTVERGFNRVKHWRGIATRYDKYALTYLGGVTLAGARRKPHAAGLRSSRSTGGRIGSRSTDCGVTAASDLPWSVSGAGACRRRCIASYTVPQACG
jgi:putative transposase